MTIQFSNNPGISVRICTDLYRFAGSAQYGKFRLEIEVWYGLKKTSVTLIERNASFWQRIFVASTTGVSNQRSIISNRHVTI